MNRYFYSSKISHFLTTTPDNILGILSKNNEFSLEQTQRNAWLEQISILKQSLVTFEGRVFFEFSIPRMGRRIDVVLIINNVVFVIEFKIGEKEYLTSSLDQVWDYALDLKNFHETSHRELIVPILVASEASDELNIIGSTQHNDKLLFPLKSNRKNLQETIISALDFEQGEKINSEEWGKGKYLPTPTIIEAAMALYNNHSVDEITRSDASAINLSETTTAINRIIKHCRTNNEKGICFITGVPGAGKTLVGLKIATENLSEDRENSSVFLSGNGPLVAVLREALTRDRIIREREKGNKVKKGEEMSKVKMFIQNVHHFRDDILKNMENPPFEHIAIFDEAQRAWDLTQTSNFMSRKKNVPNFSQSEPEFLISSLDRHKNWALIVCLVGGGQEINTGEAGIKEWIISVNRSFPNWNVYISDKLTDSEYAAGEALQLLESHRNVFCESKLHLAVSLRSYRAENLASLIKNLLDLDIEAAKANLKQLKEKYPIIITRDVSKAKKWLREKARGSERYGIIVSSQAQRLKPYAIDVRSPMDPIHWFLDGKEDVRSSYYLEDVATEFHVQGLELDWSCVTWDADFRYSNKGWQSFSFVGEKWNNINKPERKQYLKNAYRVLLTRARQGMIIVVPNGDQNDPTRNPTFYDPTYEYLLQIGFDCI